MSALEALVLAGKGLNAFSVLFFCFLQRCQGNFTIEFVFVEFPFVKLQKKHHRGFSWVNFFPSKGSINPCPARQRGFPPLQKEAKDYTSQDMTDPGHILF
jgi:hypothetical protein